MIHWFIEGRMLITRSHVVRMTSAVWVVYTVLYEDDQNFCFVSSVVWWFVFLLQDLRIGG
jgi:hypothetical protein